MLLAHAHAPAADDIAMAIGASALALAFDRFRYEFDVHGARIVTAPNAGFHVLLVLAVDPVLAAAAGACIALGAARHLPTASARVYHVATGTLTIAIPALAVRTAFGDDIAGRHVLVAVLLGSTLRASLTILARLLAAQAASATGAIALLRHTPVGTMLMLETGLPTATVAAAGPFLDTPLPALAIVLAGQALTWRLLALQHSHFTGRRDADRLLDTFERYVPRDVAHIALRDGAAIPGGERRELTVLFLDVRGFTSWAERTDPGEVFDELNLLLGELTDAVLAENGTIDKFTGDGLMAFWNAPSDQPDHAARAVRTIPRLLMRVRECNLRRATRGGPPFRIGVGIATGPAMVGNLGHDERLAFTAIGDTVNRAARIEHATRDVGIPTLLDESTFLALPLDLQRQLTRLDSIEVKGRAERIRLYAPTAVVKRRFDDDEQIA